MRRHHGGVVNAADLGIVIASFHKPVGDAGFNSGAGLDLDGSGIVDVFDLAKVGLNFGRTGPVAPAGIRWQLRTYALRLSLLKKVVSAGLLLRLSAQSFNNAIAPLRP